MKEWAMPSHLQRPSPMLLVEIPHGAWVTCQLLLKLCNIHSRSSTPVRGVSGATARVHTQNFSRVHLFSIHSAQKHYVMKIVIFKIETWR